MGLPLEISIIGAQELSETGREEIISLCRRAYEEPVESLFAAFLGGTHVLGRRSGLLVSQAMWVTRYLQVGESAPLHTAYVEMVATAPEHQGQGYATAVMQRLAEAIVEYELGALCPAEPGLYARLGWVMWRGPLFIRQEGALLATPHERIMILRLPGTPSLDLDAPLSAEWRPGELW
jgi:aminoglycoside 2'-N-acetyltransferase I